MFVSLRTIDVNVSLLSEQRMLYEQDPLCPVFPETGMPGLLSNASPIWSFIDFASFCVALEREIWG